MDKRGEYYTHRHGNMHEISFATQQTVGWSALVLGVLVGMGEYFGWSSAVQYLLATLIALAGIWLIATR